MPAHRFRSRRRASLRENWRRCAPASSKGIRLPLTCCRASLCNHEQFTHSQYCPRGCLPASSRRYLGSASKTTSKPERSQSAASETTVFRMNGGRTSDTDRGNGSKSTDIGYSFSQRPRCGCC
jgi:hypothetical protein